MAIGQIPWNKGRRGVYSEESLEKMRQNGTGRPAWNKGISDNLTHKRCSRCGVDQPIDNFYRMKKGQPLRVPQCILCQRKEYDEWRATEHGREVIRNQFKKRYERKTKEYIDKATKRAKEKPAEVSAAGRARYALKIGLIEQRPCEKCGSEKSEKHHPDYEQPLKVQFLCRSCHMKEHHGGK